MSSLNFTWASARGQRELPTCSHTSLESLDLAISAADGGTRAFKPPPRPASRHRVDTVTCCISTSLLAPSLSCSHLYIATVSSAGVSSRDRIDASRRSALHPSSSFSHRPHPHDRQQQPASLAMSSPQSPVQAAPPPTSPSFVGGISSGITNHAAEIIGTSPLLSRLPGMQRVGRPPLVATTSPSAPATPPSTTSPRIQSPRSPRAPPAPVRAITSASGVLAALMDPGRSHSDRQ